MKRDQKNYLIRELAITYMLFVIVKSCWIQAMDNNINVKINILNDVIYDILIYFKSFLNKVKKNTSKVFMMSVMAYL